MGILTLPLALGFIVHRVFNDKISQSELRTEKQKSI